MMGEAGHDTFLSAMGSRGGNKVFLGSFVHSKSREKLEYLDDTGVFVDGKGVIVALERDCDRRKAEDEVIPKLGWEKNHVEIVNAKKGLFFFPGFIGMSTPASSNDHSTESSQGLRHPRPRLAVPERRHLRKIHPP